MKFNIKVLHVEDDLTEADIIKETLGEYDRMGEIEIVHVSTLKEALFEIKNNDYQAVLLDLGLRELDGLDNVSAIKEENPDLAIVVLSNGDSQEQAGEAIDCGAQEYLVKGHSDGKVIKFAIYSSIKRKALERKLFHQANYDNLTGLPNRALLQEHLGKSLRLAKRWKSEQALLFMDLNKFKLVNDTYGHENGNRVLKEAARRLMLALRDTDVVARYGGDEFTVILDDQSTDVKHAAKCVAQKIVDAMSEKFTTLLGEEIEVGVSIGIAIYPADGADSGAILAAADAAMYKAKSQGQNSICLYAEEDEVQVC